MTKNIAAFFDVDGTIVHGNVVRYYANLHMARLSRPRRLWWIATFLPRIPGYFLLDKVSRRSFNLVFYRNYTTFSPAELEQKAKAHFQVFLEPRIYPQAYQQIEAHHRQKHQVVLVTGSLEPIIRPLATQLGVSALIAARLSQQNGVFTGELQGGPMTDERKAKALHLFADQNGLDLSRCYAYADGLDDLPMLQAVGRPTAVNPGLRLRRSARQKGWEIVEWKLE